MPGGSSPWLDTGPPAQFVTAGGSGATGPIQTVFRQGEQLVNPSSSSYDSTLHYKLAGTVVLALVTVFVLQQLGFRFVVAAGIGR